MVKLEAAVRAPVEGGEDLGPSGSLLPVCPWHLTTCQSGVSQRFMAARASTRRPGTADAATIGVNAAYEISFCKRGLIRAHHLLAVFHPESFTHGNPRPDPGPLHHLLR